MIRVVPGALHAAQMARLRRMRPTHHHEDEGHTANTTRLGWAALAIRAARSRVWPSAPIAVSPHMKIHRLYGRHGAVPLHVDPDYVAGGLYAGHSVLVRLSDEVRGRAVRPCSAASRHRRPRRATRWCSRTTCRTRVDR